MALPFWHQELVSHTSTSSIVIDLSSIVQDALSSELKVGWGASVSDPPATAQVPSTRAKQVGGAR